MDSSQPVLEEKYNYYSFIQDGTNSYNSAAFPKGPVLHVVHNKCFIWKLF